MNSDILNEPAGPPNGGAGKDISSVIPKPGRGGARPGAGRPPKSGTVATVAKPPEPKPRTEFLPEHVRPLVVLPFKLAAVALRSDAVDLEEDEAAILSVTGARAATEWLEVSPKGMSLAIFGTAIAQVLLAKIILYRQEKKQKDAPAAT